jgi:hypothetical protein
MILVKTLNHSKSYKGERKDFDWSWNVSDTVGDDSYTAVEDYFRSDPDLVKVLE